MGKRSLLFEENDDDTTLLTMNMGDGEEHTFLLPFGFDSFSEMIPEAKRVDMEDLMERGMVHIPNQIEE